MGNSVLLLMLLLLVPLMMLLVAAVNVAGVVVVGNAVVQCCCAMLLKSNSCNRARSTRGNCCGRGIIPIIYAIYSLCFDLVLQFDRLFALCAFCFLVSPLSSLSSLYSHAFVPLCTRGVTNVGLKPFGIVVISVLSLDYNILCILLYHNLFSFLVHFWFTVLFIAIVCYLLK